MTEYSHERAVADGVNVGFEVYRIKTKISGQGSTVEAGYYVDKRDKLTRETRWEQLDEDLDYGAKQLDRSVVAPDQIRTIVREFRDRLFTELFPGRKEVPKTLIFAKNDSHAEDILGIVREEFGKGNDFAKKITYRTTGEKAEDLIASFRNSYHPRIAVTVDMISTGTDIKPLECIIFMRDVRSRVYFEQMKGRGTRTINPSDLIAVTPDASYKTHFVIVDCVGVCETVKTESRPLERKRSVPFDRLVASIAMGVRDDDTITSLAGRLGRLDKEIDEPARAEISAVTDGVSLRQITNQLLDAVDPDCWTRKAVELFDTHEPTEGQLKQAKEVLVEIARAPFDNPAVRDKLIEVRQRSEQVIDTVSQDTVTFAGFDEQARERARQVVATFRQFIEDNKDELTALQLIYSRPYGQHHLTYDAIRQLADTIEKPPYTLTTDTVWKAYETLEQARVKHAGPGKLLTNIISLIRFTIGETDVLEPFSEVEERRFSKWLAQQQAQGREFTPEQLEWLRMIKDHIVSSLSIGMEDFEYAPFHDKGGVAKVVQLFGRDVRQILQELNEVLAA